MGTNRCVSGSRTGKSICAPHPNTRHRSGRRHRELRAKRPARSKSGRRKFPRPRPHRRRKTRPGGIVGRIEGLVHDVIDDIEDFLFPTCFHLPLGLIYPHAPAIPVSLEQTVDTLGRLLIRTFQTKQAMQGLTNRYKLDGLETYGRDFLVNQNSKTRRVNNLAELKSALGPGSTTEFVGNFMKMAFDEVANTEATKFTGPLTQLSLEDPTQWTIGWTTLGVPVATEY
jgi:hypothetical protein